MNCLHASNHAHTCHHIHRLLYTILLLFLLTIVVHMCIYTFTITCMYSLHSCSCSYTHSMFSVLVITNIWASSTTTDRPMFHELFPWIVCMQVIMRILVICHHVLRPLYTILLLFLFKKIVVHMCVYTFTTARLYSLQARACIHSMFSVHACTNINYMCIVIDNRSTDVPLIV